MTQTDILIECANCGRPVHEADAEDLGWRFYSDGVGELVPFCSLCAHREFRPTPRPRLMLMLTGVEPVRQSRAWSGSARFVV